MPEITTLKGQYNLAGEDNAMIQAAPNDEFSKSLLRSAIEFKNAPHRYYISDWRGDVLVLKFFGDESFGHRQTGSQGCYAVAGYIAHADNWRIITDDWHKALAESPGIEYFHMSECFSVMERREDKFNPGQFAGMTSQQARSKLNRMIDVLETHGGILGAVQSLITWDCFQHALDKADVALFKSPYTLCVQGVFDMCCQMLEDARIQSPISVTLDEGDDVAAVQIHRSWIVTKRSSPPKVAALMQSIEFADDRQCIPLQCADLLAWHARRQFIQPAEDHGRPREEFVRLREQSAAKVYAHTWSEEELRRRRDEKRKAIAEALAEKQSRRVRK